MQKNNRWFYREDNSPVVLSGLGCVCCNDEENASRLKNREILWNDDIDESMIDVSMYILKWNAEDKALPVEVRKPIKIFINSDGGCANTVMHVIDTILLSNTPVITIGLGKVYSAGAFLLMAGRMRYVFPHTKCLIHDGSTGFIGDNSKVVDGLRFTERLNREAKEYVLAQTNIPENEYDANYRRDWFLDSDQMIEYGVADAVIDNIDAIV